MTDLPRHVLGKNPPQIIHTSNLNRVDRDIFIFHNIFVAIKLDNSNFTIWRYQILNFLRSLGLEAYVLGKAYPRYLIMD